MKWFSEKILIGTTDLSEGQRQKIKTLVGKRIQLVKRKSYINTCRKTRYVSVQVKDGTSL
jgi:hypothetical protein